MNQRLTGSRHPDRPRVERTTVLAEALRLLSKERAFTYLAIALYGASYELIAEKLQISRDRVHPNYTNAVSALRHPSQAVNLRDYLDDTLERPLLIDGALRALIREWRLAPLRTVRVAHGGAVVRGRAATPRPASPVLLERLPPEGIPEPQEMMPTVLSLATGRLGGHGEHQSRRPSATPVGHSSPAPPAEAARRRRGSVITGYQLAQVAGRRGPRPCPWCSILCRPRCPISDPRCKVAAAGLDSPVTSRPACSLGRTSSRWRVGVHAPGVVARGCGGVLDAGGERLGPGREQVRADPAWLRADAEVFRAGGPVSPAPGGVPAGRGRLRGRRDQGVGRGPGEVRPVVPVREGAPYADPRGSRVPPGDPGGRGTADRLARR